MHNDSASLWSERAARFPGGRDSAHRTRMLERLSYLPQDALPRAGTRCLDVGAGTGVFSLYAADLGADVVATDISDGMLAQLSANDPQARVKTLSANWQGIDPQAQGWTAGFDLVLAQMVPAVCSVEDFRRMEACSRGWCVYIGWGRKRHDPWLEVVFSAHGIELSVPLGVPNAVRCLAELGRAIDPIWIEETWHPERPVESAVLDAMSHLRMRGLSPNKARIEAMADQCAEDGVLRGAARVEIGVLAWRVI